MLREFVLKGLSLLAYGAAHRPRDSIRQNFPGFSRVTGKLRGGDGFADDCFHRQPVPCFSREILFCGIIVKIPRPSCAKVGAIGRRERHSDNSDAFACRILCSAICRSGYVAPAISNQTRRCRLTPALLRTEKRSLSALCRKPTSRNVSIVSWVEQAERCKADPPYRRLSSDREGRRAATLCRAMRACHHFAWASLAAAGHLSSASRGISNFGAISNRGKGHPLCPCRNVRWSGSTLRRHPAP